MTPIELTDFDVDNPPANGHYVVFCEAPAFDSCWYDLATFEGGLWCRFLGLASHPSRVRAYALLPQLPDTWGGL